MILRWSRNVEFREQRTGVSRLPSRGRYFVPLIRCQTCHPLLTYAARQGGGDVGGRVVPISAPNLLDPSLLLPPLCGQSIGPIRRTGRSKTGDANRLAVVAFETRVGLGRDKHLGWNPSGCHDAPPSSSISRPATTTAALDCTLRPPGLIVATRGMPLSSLRRPDPEVGSISLRVRADGPLARMPFSRTHGRTRRSRGQFPGGRR